MSTTQITPNNSVIRLNTSLVEHYIGSIKIEVYLFTKHKVETFRIIGTVLNMGFK